MTTANHDPVMYEILRAFLRQLWNHQAYLKAHDISLEVADEALENLFDRPVVEILVDVLDQYFEGWTTAEWDFHAEWVGDHLIVEFLYLTIDEIPVRDGDPEDMPHPVFKRIAEHVDVIELCIEGITEIKRDEYD